MRVLVTGAAGFIGYHLSQRLLARGDEVVGLDNLNAYYDVSLKEARLRKLTPEANFSFHKLDIADRDAMQALFKEQTFDCVVNLAAQAGVRYSLENPAAYIDANVVGFGNILEGCRQQQVKHCVYASSSSVYGANGKQPFSEHDAVGHPLAFYGATKRANELMAHSYAHLYRLPCTGLRFFTVYGPWGRPDMALFKFTRNILEGKPIEVYNNGDMVRDFTFVDDIVTGVVHVIDNPAQANNSWKAQTPDLASSNAPYRVYNIGNNAPVQLQDFIMALENALEIKAEKKYLPLQAGDVISTYADTSDLQNDFGFKPSTPINQGVSAFVAWYKEYYLHD